jgi:hypothetical protein
VRTSLMTGFPFSRNETFTRLATRTDQVTLTNPFPAERGTLAGVVNQDGYDVNAPTGDLQSYNLTVERDIGGGAALEIGFVGSKGTHLGRQYDLNLPRRSLQTYLAGFTAAQLRPIQGLNAIQYYSFGSNSIYNAAQISLRKRGRGGTFYRINYSLSKSIDDASQVTGNSTGGFLGAQNPEDLRSERGRSDFDRSHVFTAAFSWQIPVGRNRRFLNSSGGFVNGLLGGWQLSGTGTIYSGQPFTVTTAGIDTNLGESLRPNRLGSGLQKERQGAGRKGIDYPWFNTADFERTPRCTSIAEGCAQSPNGFLPFDFGNSGRNILEGPGTQFMNASLMKNFRRERRNVQVRLECFSPFNNPNFLLPERTFNSPGSGYITGVSGGGRGGPRVFQASTKFEF